MKYLCLELYKLKRRKVFLTFVLILGVELLFVFSNYGNNENFLGMISDPNAPAWEDLIVGPATMNGLFLPILSAVIASRICDMEHRGNTWKLLECNNENHATQMKNAADQADVVVCVGWEFYDVETIAPEYPNVKFIWIDNATSEPVANVLNITYAQNEGSFLAGYIAAAMSETGTVGAVGGEDSDTINDFIVGYTQGAEYYGTENGKAVNVVKNYAGTYDDPAKGKECALALHDQGADVIFQIASATGDGVFEAAKENGFYAIGVDSDQKYIDPDTIICSMKKEVGSSIYDAVKRLLDGDSSLWGTTWVADMSNGYVGIGYGEDGAAQQVPDDVKNAVEELSKKIVSGEITVETTR
jgi:basic membrane protein A